MPISPWIAKYDEIESLVKGKKPLLVGSEHTLTYGDLLRCVRRMAALCDKLGIASGDRVIIATRDEFSLVRLFFSFLRLGVTSVILDPGAGKAEGGTLAEAADVRGVFADKDFLERMDLRDRLKPETVYVPISAGNRPAPGVVGRVLGRKGGAPDEFPGVLDTLGEDTPLPEALNEGDVAYILFTSGTTSRPKGVEITHRNLFAQEQTFVRQYGFDASVQLLNVLPMFHTDGITHGPVLAFMAGATLHRPVIFRVDTLDHLLKSIYTLQITHFITVPAVLGLIHNSGHEFDDCFRSDDFRFLISTAAYLDPNLWQAMEQRFGIRIVNVYGLTETVCEALYCGPDDDTRKVGTVGKPVDCEARIVDSSGNEVPPGEVGELTLKGDHVMRGYFRQPEETAEVLKDGWFYTGDLAKVDDEGFYHIVGRKKNVIITAGINVYPEDVTSVLRGIPGVVDAVTFGLEDQTWGERVVSCIEMVNGKEVPVEEIVNHCADGLAREKIPNKIYFMPELPRGPAGKVILNDVKEYARRQLTEESGQQLEGDVKDRLRQLAARQFKSNLDHITLESNPDNTAGWNSLAHVEFLMAIEEQFDIKIGPRDFMNIHSVGDALRLVEDKLAV